MAVSIIEILWLYWRRSMPMHMWLFHFVSIIEILWLYWRYVVWCYNSPFPFCFHNRNIMALLKALYMGRHWLMIGCFHNRNIMALLKDWNGDYEEYQDRKSFHNRNIMALLKVDISLLGGPYTLMVSIIEILWLYWR